MPILIVDDEEDVRESLKEVLTVSGYDVATASSGEEAIRFMEAQNVSALLVDFSMPGMTGEELLFHLEKRQMRPPSLVITALAPWRMVNLIEAGIGYMRKPLNNSLLLSSIKNMLSRENTAVK